VVTQKTLSIPADAVIGKFCYSFSVALLRKLESLIEAGEVFVTKGDPADHLTPIASAVVSKLIEQISYNTHGFGVQSEQTLKTFVSTVREFLAMFEVQK
jgi:hypothetical protein